METLRNIDFPQASSFLFTVKLKDDTCAIKLRINLDSSLTEFDVSILNNHIITNGLSFK